LGRSLEILIPVPLRVLHQHHVQAFAASSEVGRAMGAKESVALGQ
jgi:hypothetical protein